MTQMTIMEDGEVRITGLDELLTRVIKKLIVTIAKQLLINENHTN